MKSQLSALVAPIYFITNKKAGIAAGFTKENLLKMHYAILRNGE